MQITIDGVPFSNVTELNVKREMRRTEIRYNTRGDMLIDLVNRKYKLTVRFGLLTEKELKLLRGLTKEIFVTVKFPAPESDTDDGMVTGEFHISDEPAPTVTVVNGITMFGGVELVMRQK